MKNSRYTEEQTIAILKQHEASAKRRTMLRLTLGKQNRRAPCCRGARFPGAPGFGRAGWRPERSR